MELELGLIEANQQAPDWTLVDQDGRPRRLSDYRGRVLILFFYPRADTPGCTTQACSIRDRSGEYEAAGATVVGVSPDEPAALRKFADKHDLPFTLLADPDHAIAEAYGAWGERSMYGKKFMGIIRSTTIVDGDGKVARHFPKVTPKTHDDVILKALSELAGAG